MIMPYMFSDEFFDDMFDLGRAFTGKKDQVQTGRMPADILEDENGYEVRMYLPGYKKENIRVELAEGVLTVTAKEDPEKKTEGTCLRRERKGGNLTRRFSFRRDLEKDGLTARYEDGVLILALPKKKAEKTLIAIAG